MQRNCNFCGKAYEAKRPTSKFCGSSCRGKNSTAGGRTLVEQAARRARPSGKLVATTERDLAAAGVLDSILGAAAVELARAIESEVSGSARASMTRELRALVGEVLGSAEAAADPLDELAARRDAKRASG